MPNKQALSSWVTKVGVGHTTPLWIGVVVALVVALAGAGLFTEVLGRNEYQVSQRAGDFLLKQSAANSLLIDMETGVRGYIIVGREDFLEPYNSAVKALPRLWEQLAAGATRLDAERPSGLGAAVAEMQKRAGAWQQGWAEPQIAARRAGRSAEVTDAASALQGKQLFDRFRTAGEEANRIAENLLASSTHELNQTRTAEVILILGIGVLALASALYTAIVARRENASQRAAVSLAEGEAQRLQAILDNMPVAVRLMGAPDGKLILQNGSARAMFPISRWNELAPEERSAAYKLSTSDGRPLTFEELPSTRTMREGATVKEYLMKVTQPDLGTMQIMVNSAPVFDADGHVTEAVVVLQDVTRLREIDQRKDEFIATAAHELRNPLAALSGYNQLVQKLLARGDSPDKVARHLVEMGKMVVRMNNLVERLLDASRIQLGRLQLQLAPCDIMELARQVVAGAQSNDSDNHKIAIEGPDKLVGNWDSARVEQVITNLLGNALRYSPAGSQVQIRVEVTGDPGKEVVRVAIADRGPGVPAASRPHLFDRYYQAPQDEGESVGTPEMAQARHSQGLGLGLYISKEIVQAQGGEIGMDANTGGGSIFWFTLPLRTPANHEAAR